MGIWCSLVRLPDEKSDDCKDDSTFDQSGDTQIFTIESSPNLESSPCRKTFGKNFLTPSENRPSFHIERKLENRTTLLRRQKNQRKMTILPRIDDIEDGKTAESNVLTFKDYRIWLQQRRKSDSSAIFTTPVKPLMASLRCRTATLRRVSPAPVASTRESKTKFALRKFHKDEKINLEKTGGRKSSESDDSGIFELNGLEITPRDLQQCNRCRTCGENGGKNAINRPTNRRTSQLLIRDSNSDDTKSCC